MREVIKQTVSSYQIGFQQGKGTTEAIDLIQQLIYRNRWKDQSIAFLDLSKAFDSANRKILWRTLLERNCPIEWVEELRKWHQKSKMTASFEGEEADPVLIDKGVYQGSPLSPLLYLIYADEFNKTFQEETEKKGTTAESVSTKLQAHWEKETEGEAR